MQRNHQFIFEGVFQLILVEILQLGNTHERSIDEFILLQLDGFFEHFGCAIRHFEDNLHSAGVGHQMGLFIAIKITPRHVAHVRAAGLGPESHAVWVLLRVLFHRTRNASIRITFLEQTSTRGGEFSCPMEMNRAALVFSPTFAQDGIYGTAHERIVAFLDLLFFVIGRIGGIQRNIIALSAEFGDTIEHLVERR
jgi:hypothetical protein